jgi:hypothetical protein
VPHIKERIMDNVHNCASYNVILEACKMSVRNCIDHTNILLCRTVDIATAKIRVLVVDKGPPLWSRGQSS